MAVHGYRMSEKAGPVHGVGMGFSYQHIELQEDQRQAISGVGAPLYQGEHPMRVGLGVLSAFAPNVTAGLRKERPAYPACKMASTAVARRKWSSRRRLAGTGWLWRVRRRRKARSSS